MRKLIVFNPVTLEGFFVGPREELKVTFSTKTQLLN